MRPNFAVASKVQGRELVDLESRFLYYSHEARKKSKNYSTTFVRFLGS